MLYWSVAPKLSRQIFFRAQLKQLFQKYPMMTQRRSETHSTSLCVMIRFVQTAKYDRATHWSNCHVGLSMHYDTICPTTIKLFAIQSDFPNSNVLQIGALKRLASAHALRSIRFVLLAIMFLQYDPICSDSDHLHALRCDLSCC